MTCVRSALIVGKLMTCGLLMFIFHPFLKTHLPWLHLHRLHCIPLHFNCLFIFKIFFSLRSNLRRFSWVYLLNTCRIQALLASFTAVPWSKTPPFLTQVTVVISQWVSLGAYRQAAYSKSSTRMILLNCKLVVSIFIQREAWPFPMCNTALHDLFIPFTRLYLISHGETLSWLSYLWS